MTTRILIPMPDLRIIPVAALHAHETHDSQRSQPLIERMQTETVIINPPVVAPLHAGSAGTDFVVLDGANRVHTFATLGYPHLLVQVATYESGQVELSTWAHVVCAWTPDALLASLLALEGVALHEGYMPHAIAHVMLRDDRTLAVCLHPHTHEADQRNAAIGAVVGLYQRSAILQRAAYDPVLDHDPAARAALFAPHPDAIALVTFPACTPADIVTAARTGAYLPPGVSRHIVHGRAVRVNYPLDRLRDPHTPLDVKNEQLAVWQHEKIARRQVRFYAESTYQFDE